MEQAQKQLEEIIKTHGHEATVAAAAKVLQAVSYQPPADVVGIIGPNMLTETADRLDQAVVDIVERGQAKEEAYGDKRGLLLEVFKLREDVKLTEAQAFMEVEGEGRNQYAVLDGKQVPLNNDVQRDAYRRAVSKDVRTRLAKAEGELNALEIDIAEATDSWYTAKEVADLTKNRANLQAALLHFLSLRG